MGMVPHSFCYPLPRAEFERLVEGDEMSVDPTILPGRVIAFRGARAGLLAGDPEAFTLAWRAIFHGHVHEAFDAHFASGRLTAAAVREGINRIGQTEFDE